MLCSQRVRKQPAFYGFLFVVSLILVLWVTAPWVHARERSEPQTKPQEWQINGILAALDDKDPGVQGIAFNELVQFDTSDLATFPKQSHAIAQKAIQLVNDNKPESYIRLSAIWALGVLGKADGSMVQSLMALVTDSNTKERVRDYAIEALGSLGKVNGEVVPFVMNLIEKHTEDGDKFNAKQVFKALVNLSKDDDRVVQLLVDLVNESSPQNSPRFEAIKALGTLRKIDERVVQSLIKIVDNSKIDLYLRRQAVHSLNLLGKSARSSAPSLMNLVRNSGNNTDLDLRKGSVEALGSLGQVDENIVTSLRTLTNDSNTDIDLRIKAIQALGNLGKADAQMEKFLVSLAEDNKSDQQNEAVKALGSVGKIDEGRASFLTKLAVDRTVRELVRSEAIRILGLPEKIDQSILQSFISLIKDRNMEGGQRYKAMEALGKVGRTDQNVVKSLTNLIDDRNLNLEQSARTDITTILGDLKRLNLSEVFTLIDQIYYDDSRNLARSRFIAYFYGGGDRRINTLLKWIGRVEPKNIPTRLPHAEAKETLEIFQEAWGPSQPFEQIRGELAPAIAKVVNMGSWGPTDIPLLTQHAINLTPQYRESANSVRTVIESFSFFQFWFTVITSILTHLVIWGILIFQYSKSLTTQAVFFWNPWVRNIVGLGYISTLLVTVPFLRNRLLAPFRNDLNQAAGLDQFDPTTYFKELRVKRTDWTEGKVTEVILPLKKALPEIKGQIMLQAPSGLGKTMLVRHLIQKSPRLTVFLTATECAQAKDHDVIQAIQAKLPITHNDPNFLKSLIYSGAIDICIDGLNEINAEAQASIKQFLSSYTKGNIILTTQPLSDKNPPQSTKLYHLLPLEDHQIFDFLSSRQPKGAILQGKDYQQACQSYCKEVLENPKQTLKDIDTLLQVGSNPNLENVLKNLNQTPHELETIQTLLTNPNLVGTLKSSTPTLKDLDTLDRIRTNPNLEDVLKNLTQTPEDLEAIQRIFSKLNSDVVLKTKNQILKELEAIRRVLSNPMDLDIVAEMLAQKVEPKLFHLQQQLYDRMATDYASTNNGFGFPLSPVANLAYDMRLSDQNLLPQDKLSQEILDMLEKYKLLTPKFGSWQFRHDKIWDFFIVKKFLETQEAAYDELKETRRMSDTRLRGVYVELASELKLSIAQALEKSLFDYASKHNDHNTSDLFRKRLEARP